MGCGGSKNKKDKIDDNQNPTHKEGVRRKYKFEDIIGSGKFGKVVLAYNKLDTTKSQKVAIKAIKMKKVKDILQMIGQEIKTLESLDHPNIVKYYETRYGMEYVYIVMEYCAGGMLFDKLTKMDIFSEKEAGRIMEKLLRGIAHCHANGIIHRDIKPENIMYSSKEKDAEIKLIDFGLSKIRKSTTRGGGHSEPEGPRKRRGSLVGTPLYIAPEVLTGFYSNACDIWSLGVICYILLSGYFPFYSKTTELLLEKIEKAELSFEKNEWRKVSDQAKDLIIKMLNRDDKQRYTATQCLEHPWFESLKSMTQVGHLELDPDILEKLKECRQTTGFQKEVMNVLVESKIMLLTKY